MPSPRSHKRYPVVWLEFFDRLKDNPHEVITVECEGREGCTPQREAHALRAEFYKARTTFLKDEGFKKEYEAALNGREVLVRGNVVVFGLKDENWVAKLLGKSLQK